MKYFTKYEGHSPKIEGKRKKYDANIYTFDIETSSFFTYNDELYPAKDYLKFTEEERENFIYHSNMWIWMFGINDTVYYGRTWEEFKTFIRILDNFIEELKFVFVHNLAFEFQYLRGVFNFKNVVARKSHKVMCADLEDYNLHFQCTLFMTDVRLALLPGMYNLPVEKMVGDLDYTRLRHSETEVSIKELGYCENDCLVLYYYILEELKTYKTLPNIPKTSTGHVRRELQNLVRCDYKYRRLVNKAINTNPHVYNRLQEAFMGGYTHANWIYTDEVIKNVDSWDFTSSYPYVMTTYKYPGSEFKPCKITSISEMSERIAYLLVVKFKNVECKYFNNFISASKCRNIRGAKYDNGRIMSAEEFEITLTDVDFRFIIDSYRCEYEIIESYYSNYTYLPIQFIRFILDKYVIKTQYKGVVGKEVEYQKEKGKFNSLYGMSVTNTIRDEVVFDNDLGWSEIELTNDVIEEKLLGEKKKSFLSFAYGVWVTAHARNNLLRNVIKLDDYVLYCDTDSIKLREGYDKKVIEDYNESVKKRIENTSKLLKIPVERFAPKDIKGKERMLGLFDDDGHYTEFITQGAKKYAVKEDGKIKITVAGVPKSGAKALKKLEDFRDNFVFDHKDTNKNTLKYIDNEEPVEMTDYLGNKYVVTDKTGCCVIPTTYVLGKALDYANLISDDSSRRAIYKE